MTQLPTYTMHGHNMVYENPKAIIDGLVAYREAAIDIDTRGMSQTFLQLLMHHMSEGNIRVKVARTKEEI